VRLTTATSASRCSRAPLRAQRRPPRRASDCTAGCCEERRVRDARGETGPPSQSRARAAYWSVVSKLNAFASLSLFLPVFSSSSTTALASIFAAAPNAASNVRLLKTLLLNQSRRYQRRFTRSSLFPFSLVVPVRLLASVFPRCVPDGTRTGRSRVAYLACLLAPRACPRPTASLPVLPVPGTSPRARRPPLAQRRALHNASAALRPWLQLAQR
jgi:hypothetical protein